MKIEPISSGRDEWLSHAYTKAMRAKAKGEMEKVMQLLLNACADSSDANVVRVYGQWRLKERIFALLGGPSEEERSDGT